MVCFSFIEITLDWYLQESIYANSKATVTTPYGLHTHSTRERGTCLNTLRLFGERRFVIPCVGNLTEVKVLYVQRDLLCVLTISYFPSRNQKYLHLSCFPQYKLVREKFHFTYLFVVYFTTHPDTASFQIQIFFVFTRHFTTLHQLLRLTSVE